MPDNNDLKLKFDQRTIGDLGVKMYTRLPHALAETISNSYDADAKNVIVDMKQAGDKIELISITDDGFGMTREEVKDQFLIVGRKRRKEKEGDKQTPSGRKITGRKGLGKLAMFGIADIVEVRTVKNGQVTHFKMEWPKIETSQQEGYQPVPLEDDRKTSNENEGTKVTLRSIKRKTKINITKLSISLSQRFIFDKDFQVVVQDEKSKEVLSTELRYEGVDIEFRLDKIKDVDETGEKFGFQGKVTGYIDTTKRPLQQEMQGVALFARKKLVNEPTAFGSVSGHFFRYVTGELHIDFIDDGEDDLIATNRRSLDWDDPKLDLLRGYLKKLINSYESEWKKLRKEKKMEKVVEEMGIDEKEYEEYKKTLPEDKRRKVDELMQFLNEYAEQSQKSDFFNSTIRGKGGILEPHALYHWRYLHPKLRNDKSIFQDYTNKDYANAISKSWEILEKIIQRKSGSKKSGNNLINEVLNEGNTEHTNPQLLKNEYEQIHIDIRQHLYFLAKSVAFVSNISRHTQTTTIKDELDFENKIFSDQDCLDIISSISFLLYNLDKYTLKS